MAVQIESRGQIQDFLDVLRRRAWQIALPAVIVIVLGVCLSVIVPRKFVAKTQLELRQIGGQGAVREGQNAKFQIPAPARIKKVVEELKSPAYLALSETDRREFLRRTADNLRVDVPQTPAGIMIKITFTDLNRGWAGSFLRALRDDWKEDVLERDSYQLKDEMNKLGAERDRLEKRFVREETELANLKRLSGVSATQPVPGTVGERTEDPEYNRLHEAKDELFRTEIDLGKARAKLEGLQKRLADMPEMLSREERIAGVGHDVEIRKLESEIATLNEELLGYGRAHSKYRLILSEIATKERLKADLEALVTRSELRDLPVPNPDRLELQKEIAGVKEEVSGLEASRKLLENAIVTAQRVVSDLHEVYREVRERDEKIERLKAQLKAVDGEYQNRVRQVELGEGPRGNPFAILEEINVPNKPTEPNPMMIVAFSIVAGLGLGVGLAVLLEFSKSCFRSVYDVSRVMVVPILGNVNAIVTRREARLRRTRRLLVGSASFLILGSLAFVTWAWSAESPLLSTPLRNAIEDLRSALK